ncbi:hypothetical protein HY488_03150 [Candidatus Woesearchaeota archaeon]|nr:hypothetical protein [Candidatus Woesearchaeota archaeon]
MNKMQKLGIFLFGMVLCIFPIAMAEIPQDVTAYCTSFGPQECSQHSSWFSIDACKSMIKCVGDMDMDTFEFKGCKTVLRNVFDDCENYPSTLCYNDVAYDTSYSETCGENSARFRTIDSCGNPKEFGACIKLYTCEDATISPYIGTSITLHINCETESTASAVEERPETPQPEMEDGGERARRQEEPEPKENKSMNLSQAKKTNRTPTLSPKREEKREEGTLSSPKPSVLLWGFFIALFLAAIGYLLYRYFWHK